MHGGGAVYLCMGGSIIVHGGSIIVYERQYICAWGNLCMKNSLNLCVNF